MIDWTAISVAITAASGRPFQLVGHHKVGGGCINDAYRLRGRDGRDYFVKLNTTDKLKVLIAESVSLTEIAATNTVRVPQPVTHGRCGAHAFIVLEYLELSGRGNKAQLGEQLASLHRTTGHGFGYAQDNFIGTTQQQNGWGQDWLIFWRENRLGFQLRLAAQNGCGSRLQTRGEKLQEALPVFFSGYSPQPSLLHGDLWGGNHGYLSNGTPVIFDPAAYYGDRECDLAMTELFGGYDADFYAAYRAAWPLDDDYEARRDLYNLYHILNHAHLFGGGYVRQAEAMMGKLLAEAGGRA